MSQFARDRLGHWVNAVTTEQRRGVRYTCDCPGKHKVKLVKPLGLGKRLFRDYFAHVSTHSGKSKQTKCCANGESEAHRNAKHLLRAMQGSFSFALQQCPDCRAQVIETCARGVIDVEIASADGRWRYDCLLRVDGRPVLALEVVHTHFSSEEKVASTRADGVALAEFRAEDVMKMQEAGGGWIENLQVLVIECERCAAVAQVKWQTACWAEEVAAWVRWDQFVAARYQVEWEQGAVRRMLTGALLPDAKVILTVYWASISIFHPRFGEIKLLGPPDDDDNGLYIYEWTCHTTLPTGNLYIRLLPSWSILPGTQWRMEDDTEDNFIIFLNCAKVIGDLSCIERMAKGGRWGFKDCRWAVLKEQERMHGICANCGRKGHQSERCYKKFCIRCGRKGHEKTECFAKKDVLDRYLT